MAKKVIPAVIWKECGLYVAKTLSLEVASQGKTEEEALKNLQEAVDLLFEDENLKFPSTYIPHNPQLGQVYA